MNVNHWDERYGAAGYYYGTEPNAFVREAAARLPAGPVLCLAEGEGRNAVYLASLGHAVTAVDQSPAGLRKARELAASRGVTLETRASDLADFDLGEARWSAIVATYAHLPPELRRAMHRRVVRGLRPGGLYLLEAYTPAQLRFDTGGPRDPALLMTLAGLTQELAGLEVVIGRELEREVREGGGHTGLATVVQFLGRR